MDILDILKKQLSTVLPQLAGGSDQGGNPTPGIPRPDGLAGGLMGSGQQPQQQWQDQLTNLGPDQPQTREDAAAQMTQPAQNPVTQAPAVATAPGSVPPQADATRARVVPDQPAPADDQHPSTDIQSHQPALQRALTRREQLEQDITKLDGKDYTKPVYTDPVTGKTSNKEKPGYQLTTPAGKNYDKSHNIIDILKGIGLGALQGVQRGGGAGLLAGAAAGGIGAGINQNYDDQLLDDVKRQWKHEDIARENEYEIGNAKRDQAEAQAYDAQLEPGRKNAKLMGDLAKQQADIQDKNLTRQQAALKQSLGLKYYDPKRPDQRAIMQQAGVDPDSMPAFDDRGLVERQLDDGTKVKISGDEAWKAEHGDKVQDVKTEQQTKEFNEKNHIAVQEKNVANAMKFSDDVRSQMNLIAKANADLIAAAPESAGYAQSMQDAAASAAKAADDDDADAWDKANKAYDAASKGFSDAIGKVQGGDALAKQLKKGMPRRPDRITYQDVKPSKMGVKKISKADFAEFTKAKGWKPAQAKAYADSNGWEIQ